MNLDRTTALQAAQAAAKTLKTQAVPAPELQAEAYLVRWLTAWW